VLGYSDAAKWVYAQASGGGVYSPSALINVTEVREIHRRALEPVWAVAPHPEATDREAPGGFREHDIHPFSGGMTPPPWPDIMPQIITWVEEVSEFGDAVGSGSIPPRDLPIRLALIHNRFERIHPFIVEHLAVGADQTATAVPAGFCSTWSWFASVFRPPSSSSEIGTNTCRRWTNVTRVIRAGWRSSSLGR